MLWLFLVCRLDQSLNTVTVERALEALVALWHRTPLSSVAITHSVFQGSALSDVILTADKGFDWGTLPATAGEANRYS